MGFGSVSLRSEGRFSAFAFGLHLVEVTMTRKIVYTVALVATIAGMLEMADEKSVRS